MYVRERVCASMSEREYHPEDWELIRRLYRIKVGRLTLNPNCIVLRSVWCEGKVCVRACVRAGVRACVRACVGVCECVSVCERVPPRGLGAHTTPV